MNNRFVDLKQAPLTMWATPFSMAERVLVILIENGGIDLGIPDLVDKILSSVPGLSSLPDGLRAQFVEYLREKIRSFTDNLLETIELAANRYGAARGEFFSEVVILRDSTASYDTLKNQLIELARAGKVIDLFILTHGSQDYISVSGGVDGQKIRQMRAENGKPLSLRSVYMMNCVGSSLNPAWIDAGAKASAGALRNNYLPEPTLFFFWQNWKAGQTFENAVTGAYRKTINVMNETIRSFIRGLPLPGASLLADQVDFSNLDFVKDSAPVIQGQRSLTITTDDLTFTQSLSSDLATTVLPVAWIRALSEASTSPASPAAAPLTLSAAGLQLIKSFDPASDSLAARIAETEQTLKNNVQVSLNQNQFDALVSFTTNIGPSAFIQSTLLRRLNQADYGAVVMELQKWIKARKNGLLVEMPELIRRRTAEVELFQKPVVLMAQSLSLHRSRPSSSYRFISPSLVSRSQSNYSLMQNPAVAGIAIADAAQIGLGAIAVVQAQVSASQGSFSLSYDKAQRLLTTEARTQMPGSTSSKQSYSHRLLYLGISRLNAAEADVIIEWEGNPYGEVGTPVIRRNLPTSTEWSRSSANITISKVDRIPLPNTDPRTWPITYTFEGTYDPWGNGYFEFSGEFELNAFGGLKFNRYEVVSRAFSDFFLSGKPEDYVVKGSDVIVTVPEIPQEQVAYLRTRLP